MLDFIICGPEHSGTTLVSDLFRQVPALDSGFEVGVLLGETPRQFHAFQPFYDRMTPGWGIPAEALPPCCDTDSFAQFYARIAVASRMLAPDTARIFDKTPRYLSFLSECMMKASVPFIVMYKDPRAIIYSDFLRSGRDHFEEWFGVFAPLKHAHLDHMYRQFERIVPGGRAMTMSLERLCLEPRRACEELFAHCGHDFRLEYLLLEGLRFHNTKSNSISPRLGFEYIKGLSKDRQRKVRDYFCAFEDWFYE